MVTGSSHLQMSHHVGFIVNRPSDVLIGAESEARAGQARAQLGARETGSRCAGAHVVL